MDGNQPGDPAKAGAAILAAVESSNPPTFLLLGPDALAAYRRVAEGAPTKSRPGNNSPAALTLTSDTGLRQCSGMSLERLRSPSQTQDSRATSGLAVGTTRACS